VLIVEDHGVILAGLRALLESDPELEVVDAVQTGEDALRLCRQDAPDVVLLDYGLPGMGGLQTLREIHKMNPAIRVVVLSGHADEERLNATIAAGAQGYVVKSDSLGEIQTALREAAHGRRHYSEPLRRILYERIQQGGRRPKPILRARETEVLRLVAMGKTSKEVAAELRLQAETVRTYRKIIMRKLGVTNLAQLTRVAVETGLIDPN
jgi:DNA-binding NarL/FixJ family response regulator